VASAGVAAGPLTPARPGLRHVVAGQLDAAAVAGKVGRGARGSGTAGGKVRK